jgi:hypothetical protein
MRSRSASVVANGRSRWRDLAVPAVAYGLEKVGFGGDDPDGLFCLGVEAHVAEVGCDIESVIRAFASGAYRKPELDRTLLFLRHLQNKRDLVGA